MKWHYDPEAGASYIFITIKPAQLVTIDLREASAAIDIDLDTGEVMGIEIIGDRDGAVARVLERYLKEPPERLG